MPIQLTQDREDDDFVDLSFEAQPIDGAPPGYLRVQLSAVHESREVGLILEVATDMQPGVPGDRDIDQSAFRREGVRLFSEGARTSALVEAYCSLANVQPLGLPVEDVLELTAFPLQQHPVDLRGSANKLKVFHDDASTHDEYAEAYLNLDLATNRAWFNEKDPDYRPYWIRAWSETQRWSRTVLQRDPGPLLADVRRTDTETAVQDLVDGRIHRILVDAAGGARLILVARNGNVRALSTGWDEEASEPTYRLHEASPNEIIELSMAWPSSESETEGWTPVAWEDVAEVFRAQ